MSGIQRFALAERLSHWFYAGLFLVSLTSGLLMWIPATRVWMAGARQIVANYHGFVGYAMAAVPLVLFLLLDRGLFIRDLREVDAWDIDDRRWFWAAVRGRTLRGGEMPPQGRFNAGQKFNAILVAAMAAGFVITGSLLLARPSLPAWLVARALWMHSFLAVSAIALLIGHLAHVFLTTHGRDYLEAMVHGTLSEQTARERHVKWWGER